MSDARRPPGRLRHLRVKRLIGRRPRSRPPSIVRVIDLLSGLDQLDESLRDGPTIDLLESFKSFLIISPYAWLVADSDRCPTRSVRHGDVIIDHI